jgi:monofunctional biosynthetic peptidoglycan transglycosylase
VARPFPLVLAWLGGAAASGAGLLALYALVVWARLPDPAELPATGDPGPTAFMAGDGCSAHDRSFRPLAEIDPRLICTVVWSEDWQFFHHDGVDRDALRGALERNWEARDWQLGGSTITMQLARNLYLSRARTPSRKAAELAIARRLDDAWDKDRLLELYLSAAEWAPCVYGVDAAARHYFGHGADRVDLAEATFLAAMLPRPSRPPAADRRDRIGLVRTQQRLLRRLSRTGLMTRDELLAGQRAILDAWSDGWRGHEPAPPGPGWDRWRALTCGARHFRGGRLVEEKGQSFE